MMDKTEGDEMQKEIDSALEYLHTTYQKNNGPNLYDLLCFTISKLLTGRPSNAYDELETIIRVNKKEFEKTGAKTSAIGLVNDESENIYVESTVLIEEAKYVTSVLKPNPDLELQSPGARAAPWSDVRDQMHLLQTVGGIAMSSDNYLDVKLSIAMKQLMLRHPDISKARFWGFVAGRYWIFETQLTEESYTRRRVQQNASASNATDELQVPPEPSGTGVNRRVYWASTELCSKNAWIALPDVTPEQINAARRAVYFHFTGDLTAQVHVFPPFPWCEAVLLRVQIGRITAATQVAPAGFFKAKPRSALQEPQEDEEDDDDEEDEEEEGDDAHEEREAVVNRRYTPPTHATLLLRPEAWMHCMPHILQQQARVVWWNTAPADQVEEKSDDESEASGAADPRERGPPLLSPLSEDHLEFPLAPELSNICWALRNMTGYAHDSPAVLVRSLVWPGACTVIQNRRLEHVYIGWGMKASCHHRCPPLPPVPVSEPEDLKLVSDPSPEEEAAAVAKGAVDEDDEDEGEEDSE